MKPAAVRLRESRASLAAALRLLADAADGAKVIAGGQSLGPMLNLRLAQPELLVDVRAACRSSRAVRDEGDAVFLGSCTTHAAIEDGKVPDPTRGLHAASGADIAYRAVRNRGTIGGSLVPRRSGRRLGERHGAARRRDRRARARAASGEIGASGFVRGPFTTALAADEILAGVRIPRLSGAGALGPLQVLPQARRVRRGDRGDRCTIRSAALRAP